MRIYFIILSLFFCGLSFAQNTISGLVTDVNNQPVPGANIKVEGTAANTSAGFDGKFTLKTPDAFPFSIEVTMMGFGSQTVVVNSKEQEIVVVLTEESTALNEIVVSASRAPERVIESPVTIERMGLKEIKNTTAPSFYDGLENLKDVHFNTSSFSFKSVNTRGFATVANTRFMQLVDGMDNSSPALNFVLGNLLGVSDIDVANVEILPGASSALYGANAFNGIMFMNSKSPFTKEGISTYFKYGRTVQKTAGDNPFYDFGIRAAKKFTEHFAAKANFTVLSANEWIASDERNIVDAQITEGGIGHAANPNYDGLNVYGDEVTTNIKDVGKSLAALGIIPAGAVNLLPNSNVSRTGYKEQELNSNKIESVKADFSLHFRPWANDIEFILQHKLGFGNTIYQGANRYALKNFYMDQTKFEVKGKNFFARAYMTSEDAGDSYDMRFAAWNVNRAWKDDKTWFGQYAGAFIQATLNPALIGGQFSEEAKHNFARSVANAGRFEAGSASFNKALSEVSQNADLTEGAKFKDQSKLYHGDVNYNLKDIIKFGEIQVGGSVRQYVMNSEGTIFTDFDKPLKYNEFGVYTQLQKKFADDRAKFTGSVRYDKSKNFEGSVSPRVSLTYALGSNKQHNFRGSYQTGFRNPTTQDQYIGLDLGPFALIGSAPDNLARFVETREVSAAGQALGQPENVTMTGENAYTNAYGLSSVQAYDAAVASGVTQAEAAKLLEIANVNLVKPERVQAVELGYRSVVEKMAIDITGYYNKYNDFLSQERVYSPYYGRVGTPESYTALDNRDRRVYQVYTNTEAKITSTGFGVGLSRKVYSNFEVGVNYNFSDFKFDESSDPDFEPGFNTPKHRVKGSFGNDKLFKNFGFNTNVRWNTEYLWQSSFANGMVPENVVFDAQINYAIPFLKSVIKVGGANIGGKDYIQVVGAGAIGQQYYASWTINP